ncbi:unnamed protein product [Colias eurytheme]|nr:unnamed protein product [Colias eurytheme]
MSELRKIADINVEKKLTRNRLLGQLSLFEVRVACGVCAGVSGECARGRGASDASSAARRASPAAVSDAPLAAWYVLALNVV